MPLPAALQARLKKRGIIQQEEVKQIDPPQPEVREDEEIVRKGCPNAINPYHECTEYCKQRYGVMGKAKIRKKNYKLQPLPPGWFRVPDPESGAEYYWNVHTNQVSWRHPNDPRADITYPASWLQKPEEEEILAEDKKDEDQAVEDIPLPGKPERKIPSKVKTGKHPSLMKAQRQKEKLAPYRKGRANKDDDPLDPMDPASYSDVGRGTWSTGLREDSEVKTGVDTTANGPLFQQRPYPSPGDILRRNQQKKNDDDDE